MADCYYIDSTGDNPVKEFLDQRPKAKLKALRILSHIEEYGIEQPFLILKNLVAHLFGKLEF